MRLGTIITRHLIIVGHVLTPQRKWVTAAVPHPSNLWRKARRITTQPRRVWLPGEHAALCATREAQREAQRRVWLRRVITWVSRPQPVSGAVKPAQPVLTYSTRYGLRLAVSERAAAAAAERDARENGTLGNHTQRNLTRAERARQRYLASLTDAERAALDALTPEDAAALTEAYDTAQAALTGYDPQPWRGMVPAREARVSPRGADAPGQRGTASRVSVRDAHAAQAEDEHGLTATTDRPLRLRVNDDPTMTQRVLTAEYRALLADVPMAERLLWLTQVPASAYVSATVPVPERAEPVRVSHTHPAHAAAAADAQAARVALLAQVTTHTAADVSA